MIEQNNWVFSNPNQILGMGGPWIGDLIVKKNHVSSDVIIENVFFCEDSNRLYYLKYCKGKSFFSKYYFVICSVDLNSCEIIQYEMKFKLIYIKDVVNGNLNYFEAFHNNDESLLRSVKLNNRFE